jgi:hypothetical protein
MIAFSSWELRKRSFWKFPLVERLMLRSLFHRIGTVEDSKSSKRYAVNVGERAPSRRRMRLEPLEDRVLLSVNIDGFSGEDVSIVPRMSSNAALVISGAESFETDLGVWTQGTGDDGDWTKRSGTTLTFNTGPAAAHDGDYYLYTEASTTLSPGNPDKTAYLESTFDLTGLVSAELDFYYHMYGATMGTLAVDVYDGAWDTSVWSRTGEQHTSEEDPWLKATVNLAAYTGQDNVTIRIRGLTGSSLTSDMAIDSVSLRGDPGFTNPVMDAEPSITYGTANTVSWSTVTDADEYFVEYDTTSLFATPDADSGWITGTSHEFTGLTDGETYYYRVKARQLPIPATESGWSNTVESTQLVSLVDEFVWDVVGDQTVGSQFSVTITAKDSLGATLTDFSGTADLTGWANGGLTSVTISPSVTGVFVSGVWTGDITINETADNMFLRADAGGDIGDSNLFDAVTPGFTVTPTSGLVTTEAGGTDDFTIVLNTPPTANVTIDISTTHPEEASLSPTSVTFTPSNWDEPQTVTATGVPDYIVDGDQLYFIITAPAVSDDLNYHGLNPGNVLATNEDVVTVSDYYYVNDGSTVNDIYTTVVGNDANDGMTPATPKASLQALLDAVNLEPGMTVFIDTGVYNLTAGVLIDALDGGSLDGVVKLQGSTHQDGTILDLQSSPGDVIRTEAAFITLDRLSLTGAASGAGFTAHDNGAHHATISNSRIYANEYGVHLDWGPDYAKIENNLIYGNTSIGVYAYSLGSDAETPQIINNTIVANDADGIYLDNQTSTTNLLNNIIDVDGTGKYAVRTESTSLTSDYNDLVVTGGASIGYYSGAQATLNDWQTASGLDANSISADPLFADPGGSDFHLQSAGGRFDPTTETWVTDAVTSPAINTGDPVSDFSNEPLPNGDRINMGAYGNTEQASKADDDDGLHLQGTAADDIVKLWPGAPGGADHRVDLNGVSSYYDASVYDAIHIDGLGGEDTLSVYGKTSDETVEFNGLAVHVSESGVYDAYGSNFENTYVYSGGGADTASMLGTTGADKFYGLPTNSYIRAEGSAYLNYVKGFSNVTVDGAGGDDTAYLYDSDGDDSLTASPTTAEITFNPTAGGQIVNTLTAFSEINAIAENGGNDDATLTGTNTVDKFYGFDDHSYLRADDWSYLFHTQGYDSVTSDALTGDDVAYFFDSDGDDMFTASLNASTMTMNPVAGDPVAYAANNFGMTFAYAVTGNDSATLNGSAGEDRLYAKQAYSYMRADDSSYFHYAKGFDTVTANALGTGDKAYLYDSDGNDALVSSSTSAAMTLNPTVGDPVVNTANDFGEVYAYSTSGGDDDATLNGSAGADRFHAYLSYAYLKADDSSYLTQVSGFATVTANAVGAGDRAYLHDSNGDDVLNASPTSAAMTLNPTAGGQVINTATAFDEVYSYARNGGTNQAYLTGSSGDDTFIGDADWAYLLREDGTGANYFNYVRYFDEIFADPGDTIDGNDYLFDLHVDYALDTDPANGNIW